MKIIDLDRIIYLATKAKKSQEKADNAIQLIRQELTCRTDSRKDAEHVVILGKPLWIDKQNLRDKSLCKRDRDGNFRVPNGDQHFTFDNAQLAAKKKDKRCLTKEEFQYISTLPSRWSDEDEGMYFTFDRVDGGTVDIFFPASGFRGCTRGALHRVGLSGYYWSGSPSSSETNGLHLHFICCTVNPSYNSHRAHGFAVRCVTE